MISALLAASTHWPHWQRAARSQSVDRAPGDSPDRKHHPWDPFDPSRNPSVSRKKGVEPKIGVYIPPKWMVKIMEKPIKIKIG